MTLWNIFYGPDGGGGTVPSGVREVGGMGEVTDGEVGKDQLDLLGDDPVEDPKKSDDLTIEDETPPTTETDDEPEPKKIAKEPGEEDEEVEEEEEEIPEDIPQTRLSFNEIKTKYPKIFEDFPELRAVIAKEYQFSQVFPTVGDAKDALTKAEAYDTVDQSLVQGEAKPFVDHFSKNPKSFEKFLGSLTKEVRENHNDLYARMSLPAVKQVLLASLSQGRNSGNENLQKASLIIAKNLWGEDYKKVLGQKEEEEKPKEDPEKIELRQQLENSQRAEAFRFDKGVYDEGMSTLNTVANNTFIRVLKNKELNPEGKQLTKGQRAYIFKESMEQMGNALNKDQAHVRNMQSLRMKAQKAAFAGDWKARVTSAYLARAKNLLPAIQQPLILAELNGTVEKKVTKQVHQTGGGKKASSPVLRGGNSSVEKLKKGEISEEDFLASD